MRFFVLYYQTLEFTGVYQRWTTYALMPKSVSEMHFRANSKKTQFLGKTASDKSAWIKAWWLYIHSWLYMSLLWWCRTQISGEQKTLKGYCKSTRIMNVNWLFIAVGMHYVEKKLNKEKLELTYFLDNMLAVHFYFSL